MGIGDALELVRSKLGKRVVAGMGLPTRASDYGVGDVWGWIPAGVSALDYLLGGGWPVGRISEVFSPKEGESKSTMAIHAAIACQRQGGHVVWLESESALDKRRAERIGLDLEQVVLWGPPTLEDGFAFIAEVLPAITAQDDMRGRPVIIIWDTVASAPTRALKAGDSYGDGMTKQARVAREALRDLTLELFRHRAHLMFVNQTYLDIQAMKYTGGSPRHTTPLGAAIRFHSSVRVELRRIGYIEDAAQQRVGIEVLATVVKNKLCLPYRTAQLGLYGATGYDEALSSYLTLTRLGSPAIRTDGSWVTTGAITGEVADDGSFCTETVRAQGKDKTVSLARERDDVLAYWRAMLGTHWPLPEDRVPEAAYGGWVMPLEKYRLSDEGEAAYWDEASATSEPKAKARAKAKKETRKRKPSPRAEKQATAAEPAKRAARKGARKKVPRKK